MGQELSCYRCGESLSALTPPISRQDMCPACAVHLHVCKMCRHFDESVPGQCREDEAEDVFEKEKPNFCDWFAPNAAAFDPQRKQSDDDARAQLDALFGEPDTGEESAGDDALTRAAKDLFK